MATPQNGQTHSSNLPGMADKLFGCVWSFWGVGAQRVNVKNFWKCIFRESRRVSVNIFLRLYSMTGGQETPQYPLNFRGCYNIQFKPYAASKMELFVTKNRK